MHRSTLPPPSPEAAAHSAHLAREIAQRIRAGGGWIDFARFMDAALYAPGLGYYAAGAQKFGASGDFVTAPEMTPLFGDALANQVAQVMRASSPCIIEAGGGSGRLAVDLLRALQAQDTLPESYAFLELSPDLHARQRAAIEHAMPHLLPRISWLTKLPETFSGVVVANEVLDAMPVHIVAWRGGEIVEKGLSVDDDNHFAWVERAAAGALLVKAAALADGCDIVPGYESEIALAGPQWAAEWGHILQRGALILIDYGFPQREFYHAQRARGTLMCHYRHLAHTDPTVWPGLQDITAHVDFTAVIAAAHAAGLELLGYTSQAQFLINCGILDQLQLLPPQSPDTLRASGAVNKLLLPHEMGELFKAMALGRGIDAPLIGFREGDQSHRL